MGVSLLSLAHMFGGLQVCLEAEDLSAEVTTSLGHEIYDVLCVYSVMMGLARGAVPWHCLPSAGTSNIEDIFGVARPMWNMLAKLASLLAQVRNTNPVAKLIGIDTTEQDCQALLLECAAAYERVEASPRSRRTRLGSRVSTYPPGSYSLSDYAQALYHTIRILAHIEILQTPRCDPVVQSSCSSILETLLQIDRRERRVGVALPLTVGHLHCTVQVALADHGFSTDRFVLYGRLAAAHAAH